MNDLQIDYFMAVATNLSFTKTSEELFVSQPAISRQIALLEKELGVKLFARNNKQTSLTEAGKLYYDFFSNAKAELRNLKHEAELIQKDKKQIVRVGFVEGWDLSQIFPKIHARMQIMHPEVELVLNCCGVKELSTLLLTDNLDVIMTLQNSVTEINDLKNYEVAKIQKIILYSDKARQALLQHPTPQDFKDEVFFAPWEVIDKMVSHAINSYLRPYGVIPEIRFVQNHESMITCVRNALGVAICDEWTWAKDTPDLRCLPLESSDPVCVSVMKSNTSQIVKDLANAMIDCFA